MTNFKLNDYVLVKETGKKDFIKRIYKDLEGKQYLEFNNDIKAYTFDDVLLLEQPEEQTERFPSDNEAGGDGYGPADENEMVSVEKEPAAVERVGEKAAEEEYDESLDESMPVDEENDTAFDYKKQNIPGVRMIPNIAYETLLKISKEAIHEIETVEDELSILKQSMDTVNAIIKEYSGH